MMCSRPCADRVALPARRSTWRCSRVTPALGAAMSACRRLKRSAKLHISAAQQPEDLGAAEVQPSCLAHVVGGVLLAATVALSSRRPAFAAPLQPIVQAAEASTDHTK